MQEVSTHSTMVGSLCELANRLVGLGIERVVMEAPVITGDRRSTVRGPRFGAVAGQRQGREASAGPSED